MKDKVKLSIAILDNYINISNDYNRLEIEHSCVFCGKSAQFHVSQPPKSIIEHENDCIVYFARYIMREAISNPDQEINQ